MVSEDQSQSVHRLMELARESAPGKDALKVIVSLLQLDPPERMTEHDADRADHLRVTKGQSDDAGPIAFHVVCAALDVNAWEGWQNPSTNTAIRASILSTAHRAGLEAMKNRKTPPVWSNVSYAQIRITQGEECHSLSFLPFTDSESCTVTHLQYQQDVFAQGELGLLNLPQDPALVKPIPGGKETVLPLKSFVCLGAHRNGRLSETQLNYVHSQGLLAHGFDTRLLPPPEALLSKNSRMAPAKATRISSRGVDVMASSYHVADQVYTTISVVQYPPFGTHFDHPRRREARDHVQQPPFRSGFEETDDGYSIMSAQGLFADEEDLDGLSAGPDGGKSRKKGGTRRKKTLLYAYDRRQIKPLGVDFSEEDVKKRSKPWWTKELRGYQYYFVDGVFGDPYDHKRRFTMFDFDKTNRCTQRLEKHAREIMQGLWYTHSGVWNPQLSFYDNIRDNKKQALVQVGTQFAKRTIGEEWSRQWKRVIRDEIFLHQSEQGAGHVLLGVFAGTNFWYTPTKSTWNAIIQMPETKEEYIDFSEGMYEEYQNRIAQNQADLRPDQIAVPRRRKDKAIKPVVQAQQLEISRQQENTQFLLSQVLQRLDKVEL